jgi:hypothetical protein
MASDEKWDNGKWQAAVMHLLACRSEVAACPVCVEIERQTKIEPPRTILELGATDGE